MSDQMITDVDLDFLADEGERIYHEKLKLLLEPRHKGKVIAIEVESGDYFMSETVREAGLKARAKHPDKVFHFIRVGYRTVRKKR